jgi:hypothetical protein
MQGKNRLQPQKSKSPVSCQKSSVQLPNAVEKHIAVSRKKCGDENGVMRAEARHRATTHAIAIDR